MQGLPLATSQSILPEAFHDQNPLKAAFLVPQQLIDVQNMLTTAEQVKQDIWTQIQDLELIVAFSAKSSDEKPQVELRRRMMELLTSLHRTHNLVRL